MKITAPRSFLGLVLGAAAMSVGAAPSQPAMAACVLQQIAELPATMRAGRAFVSVKLNGQDNLMALDSGAFFSTLDESKAKELHLPELPLPQGAVMVGAAGFSRMGAVKVQNFELAGLPLKNITFVTTGTGGDVGAGLLGQNILGFADVEYDLPHGVVRLFRPKDCRTSSLAYWAKDVAYSVIPRIAHGAPAEKFTYATLTLNGVRLEALLDTGASTVIKRSSAGRAGVHPDDPGVKALSRTGGIGKGLMMTWSAPFKTVAIGDEEIRNTRLLMSDLQIDEDALLGIDFFISHRVFVANSQDKIYFTYEGGPVFGAEPMALERDASRAGEHKVERTESAEAEPTDAVGFLRRGAARLSRNEPDGALSDFNRAVDLAPTEPRYRFERARLFLAEKKVFEAKADLDEALRLDASYQDALLARADLYFAAHDPEKAVLDLDAASRAASPEDERRLLYARGYERAGKWELSLMQLDQWIKAHPESPEIWSGLMTRCWVRVALDRDMDKALSDCDRAVSKLRSTSAMDGRGLVHFLRHEDQDALVDFNAVLALHPKAGWALYGRSLIERREGQDKAADADRAAAIAAFPDMLREAKRMGLEP